VRLLHKIKQRQAAARRAAEEERIMTTKTKEEMES
jgi:hypothetical protein